MFITSSSSKFVAGLSMKQFMSFSLKHLFDNRESDIAESMITLG